MEFAQDAGRVPAVTLLPSLHRRTVPRDVAASRELAVQFYPSFGYRTPTGWSVVVQGCVYRPKVTWLRRQPVLGLIRHAMRVERAAIDGFRQRMRQFLVSFSSGRTVTVAVAGQRTVLGPSEKAGLIRGELSVSESIAGEIAPHGWLSYEAVLPSDDPREFTGEAQLLEPRGVSIISDVDDTLKYSNVPNRRDLFRNTFVREFVPIQGMPELYRECATAGAAFHYVSGSPWQLYGPLAQFWKDQEYPWGSFHLKRFRLRETARKMRTTSPQKAHKRAAIEPLLTAFPQRQFVLIGDSGEQDPDIYADLLRSRPQQIRGVLIRAVRGRTVDRARLEASFSGCPADRWVSYEATDEIRGQLLAWVNE